MRTGAVGLDTACAAARSADTLAPIRQDAMTARLNRDQVMLSSNTFNSAIRTIGYRFVK